MPAPDSEFEPSDAGEVRMSGQQRRRHLRRLGGVAVVVLVGDELIFVSAVSLDVGCEAGHALTHVIGVDDRGHGDLAAVRQRLHHLFCLRLADRRPIRADVGEPAGVRQIAVVDDGRNTFRDALSDGLGERGVPAPDDGNPGRLLGADLIDSRDEPGKIEVGRAGDAHLHLQLVSDLLHPDVVVFDEQRQVRLVRHPVVDLLRVLRTEIRFLRDSWRGDRRQRQPEQRQRPFRLHVRFLLRSLSRNCRA